MMVVLGHAESSAELVGETEPPVPRRPTSSHARHHTHTTHQQQNAQRTYLPDHRLLQQPLHVQQPRSLALQQRPFYHRSSAQTAGVRAWMRGRPSCCLSPDRATPATTNDREASLHLKPRRVAPSTGKGLVGMPPCPQPPSRALNHRSTRAWLGCGGVREASTPIDPLGRTPNNEYGRALNPGPGHRRRKPPAACRRRRPSSVRDVSSLSFFTAPGTCFLLPTRAANACALHTACTLVDSIRSNARTRVAMGRR